MHTNISPVYVYPSFSAFQSINQNRAERWKREARKWRRHYLTLATTGMGTCLPRPSDTEKGTNGLLSATLIHNEGEKALGENELRDRENWRKRGQDEALRNTRSQNFFPAPKLFFSRVGERRKSWSREKKRHKLLQASASLSSSGQIISIV